MKASNTVLASILKNETLPPLMLPFYWLRHTTPLNSVRPSQATEKEEDDFQVGLAMEKAEEATTTIMAYTTRA